MWRPKSESFTTKTFWAWNFQVTYCIHNGKIIQSMDSIMVVWNEELQRHCEEVCNDEEAIFKQKWVDQAVQGRWWQTLQGRWRSAGMIIDLVFRVRCRMTREIGHRTGRLSQHWNDQGATSWEDLKITKFFQVRFMGQKDRDHSNATSADWRKRW